MSDEWDEFFEFMESPNRPWNSKPMSQRVYDCPKHGQVWAYLGPECDCARCVREAREGE